MKLMQPDKVCEQAKHLMTDVVVKYGWENGPWSLRHFNAPAFTIGTSLNDTCVEEWSRLNIQSATGQVNAIEIEMARFAKTGTKLSDDEWSSLLVACGLWASVRDKILSCLMLTVQDIAEVNSALYCTVSFKHDNILSLTASHKPPATHKPAPSTPDDFLLMFSNRHISHSFPFH